MKAGKSSGKRTNFQEPNSKGVLEFWEVFLISVVPTINRRGGANVARNLEKI